MAAERLDLIIFGATGFTGKHTVKEAARLAAKENFTFGVAGRRKEALENIVKEFASDIENVPVIVADLKDEESLKKMAARAKILVNCCGPYRFYGEPVVKACIAAGTHQVDVSGEPEYVEKIQLDYDKAAKEAGVYIISTCGFDCVPCDLGIVFTQNKFEGEINSIETYLGISFLKKVTGSVIYYGTWESAVHGLASLKDLPPLRKQLYPEKLPEFQPVLKARSIIHRSPLTNEWSTTFLGADRSVALRTQRYFYEKYKQRPIQVRTYLSFQSFLQILLFAIFGGIFTLMTKFEIGRNLLLKYPGFFSYGLVNRKEPAAETIENCVISIIFKTSGWTEKSKEPTDVHKEPPNKEMVTKVSGKNPGYGLTCTALLFSALTILKESDKIPENGGVFTPGAAFAKTSIIEKLNENDIKFEVVSSIEK